MDQALIAIALLVAASSGFVAGAIVASNRNERLRQTIKANELEIDKLKTRNADLAAREVMRTTPVGRAA